MKRRCNNSTPGRSFRGGLTLIEVVASLALLGTLLVGILMARQRFTRQWSLAVRKAEAVQAADEMLTLWWSNPQSLPREGRGDIAGHPGLTWRTLTVASLDAESLDAEVVRLEVSQRMTAKGGVGRGQGTLLVVVDVLLDKQKDPGNEP